MLNFDLKILLDASNKVAIIIRLSFKINTWCLKTLNSILNNFFDKMIKANISYSFNLGKERMYQHNEKFDHFVILTSKHELLFGKD